MEIFHNMDVPIPAVLQQKADEQGIRLGGKGKGKSGGGGGFQRQSSGGRDGRDRDYDRGDRGGRDFGRDRDNGGRDYGGNRDQDRNNGFRNDNRDAPRTNGYTNGFSGKGGYPTNGSNGFSSGGFSKEAPNFRSNASAPNGGSRGFA